MSAQFLPSRNSGLRCLQAFLPRVPGYARGRNFDLGAPAEASAVSHLSPWIRCRLVTEWEVARAILDAHPRETASPFLREVLWRTYWKGWPDMRPGVWRDYLRELSSLRAGDRGPALARAREGRTGIHAFDSWARELVTTGYLHNHARMWVASIWIFTLRLPWPLGAAWFAEHLLDGDPASNTLSWRWVAGIQTPGKHYLARAENISRFTLGRHDAAGVLCEEADPIAAPPPPPPDPALIPGPAAAGMGRGRIGLLLHADDLSPAFAPAGFVAVGGLLGPEEGPEGNPAARVSAFRRAAVTGCGEAAAAACGCRFTNLGCGGERSNRAWIRDNQLDEVVYPHPPVGVYPDLFAQARAAHPELVWSPVVASWDARLWHQATGGFFRFWKQVEPDLPYQQIADKPCDSLPKNDD